MSSITCPNYDVAQRFVGCQDNVTLPISSLLHAPVDQFLATQVHHTHIHREIRLSSHQ